MSSSASLASPAFKTIEDELDFWKEGYHELDKELQELKSRVALCICSSKAEDGNENPPAKRQRMNEEDVENLMDPLNKLGDDELFEIMKYLTGKDLLEAMEVSKVWKKFIESESILMNRAMNEVVVVPTLREYSLPLANSLLYNDREKRPYKHMKGSFSIRTCFKFMKQFEPIKYFASTLETLEIDDDFNIGGDIDDCVVSDMCYDYFNDEKYFPKNYRFPKLKMLKCIGYSWLEIDDSFSFPEVTHLQIDSGDEDDDENGSTVDIQSYVQHFPKLEYLHLPSYWNKLDKGNPINHIVRDNPCGPKIKQIKIARYVGIFLKEQQNSLQVLEIYYINSTKLSWLLRDLKVLKRLIIRRIVLHDYNGGNFEENLSIETLKIMNADGQYYFDEDGNLRTQVGRSHQFDEHFLQAVPSLKELVVSEPIKAQRVQFIASNMCHLKRLVCKEITEETLQAYHEVRRNAHRYKNAAFELVAEPNHDFDEVIKNFA